MIETRRPISTDDPGVLAYVAYWRVLAPLALPWDRLSDLERRAWRAAAAAVTRGTMRLARRRPQEDDAP